MNKKKEGIYSVLEIETDSEDEISDTDVEKVEPDVEKVIEPTEQTEKVVEPVVEKVVEPVVEPVEEPVEKIKSKKSSMFFFNINKKHVNYKERRPFLFKF